MKTGKKLALTLGLASGALLALLATKTTRKSTNKNSNGEVSPNFVQQDDSEIHYI